MGTYVDAYFSMCLHTCRYILLLTVLRMLYGNGMCPHTGQYMLLYKRVQYVIWPWYSSTYDLIYASLHTCLVCYMAVVMAVVCVHIRADIYQFLRYCVCYMAVLCMCLHTC